MLADSRQTLFFHNVDLQLHLWIIKRSHKSHGEIILETHAVDIRYCGNLQALKDGRVGPSHLHTHRAIFHIYIIYCCFSDNSNGVLTKRHQNLLQQTNLVSRMQYCHRLKLVQLKRPVRNQIAGLTRVTHVNNTRFITNVV